MMNYSVLAYSSDESSEEDDEDSDDDDDEVEISEVRAAALIQLDTAHSEEKKHVHVPTETIVIEEGLIPPKFPPTRAYLFNHRNFSNLQFYGVCYICGCVGHSQRYCPLKWCTKCSTWGHSPSTCIEHVRFNFH